MGFFENLLICEVADGVAGPTCGLQFADLGARVLKIESPDGDKTREWSASEDDSAIFQHLNRGKQSIVLDFAADADRQLLSQIAAVADVLLVHIDPAVPAPDWHQVARDSPRLVLCEIDDLGAAGDFAGRAGSELTIQAMSGFNRYVGNAGGEPCRIGFEIAGTATAMSAFHAVSAALLHREKTQEGQYIRLSSLNSLLSMKSILFAAQGSNVDAFNGFHLHGPHWPADVGWKTKDGQITFDFRREHRDKWVTFCNTLGLSELPSDPRYADWHSTIHIGDRRFTTLAEPYRKILATMTSAEASRLINDLGGTSVMFHDYAEVLAHPQVQLIQPLVETADSEGRTQPQVGTPFRYDGEPRKLNFVASPSLGQHTAAIRQEFAAPAERAFAGARA